MRVVVVALGVLLFSYSAVASPPSQDSEDWQIMKDYANWISTADIPGTHSSCCGPADGRPLFEGEWRENDAGHYEVFISRRHWDTAPAKGFWIEVPTRNVIKASPVGFPIAWWAPGGAENGTVYCFAPVGGV